MPPLAPFVPLIAAGIAAAGTVTGSVISSNQAEKADKRAMAYQQQLVDEQKAAEEEEAALNAESLERSRAYGLSLLEGDSAMGNSLTGFGNTKDSNLLSSSGNTLGGIPKLEGSLFV